MPWYETACVMLKLAVLTSLIAGLKQITPLVRPYFFAMVDSNPMNGVGHIKLLCSAQNIKT
jgi:hypothetical protein